MLPTVRATVSHNLSAQTSLECLENDIQIIAMTALRVGRSHLGTVQPHRMFSPATKSQVCGGRQPIRRSVNGDIYPRAR